MALEGTCISHYQILHLIGIGGMGEVYLAKDTRIARQVAIKVVRSEPPHTGEAKSTFRLLEREIKAIAMLDHPHILPLYDFGEENVAQGLLTYMVMPFRPEGSLSNWLDRYYQNRLLSPQDLLFLLQQAASALQHAHNARIIHLDVKPSNFLIRQQEQPSVRPDLLLTDFGISRLNTATATASQNIRGTPLYMPPEQWVNDPVPETDQYALAIMTYQLITGAPPFQGSPQQVMYQHLHVPPKPPGERNLRIPPVVDKVILRALAKKPEDRFASVAHFVEALAFAWQQAPAWPGQSGDPESLILTARMLPEAEALPASPSTPHISSGTDLAVPGREKQSARQTKAPGLPSLDAEPSIMPVQAPTRASMLLPPASHEKKRNPLLPAVVGLCLLLACTSIGLGAYLVHSMVPGSVPASLASRSTVAPTNAPLPTAIHTPGPTPAVTSVADYPQLKPFYSGTATGYANAVITFSLQSEDQQGNVNMQTTFERTDNQVSAIYTCQGQVSRDRHLTLFCTEIGLPDFQLSIHGTIFADGHIEGTEEATDTSDPTYDHQYNWSAS